MRRLLNVDGTSAGAQHTSTMSLEEKKDQMIEKVGDVWRCKSCGRTANDSKAKFNLRRHVETHMEIAHYCQICGSSSASSHGLAQHMAKKHPVNKPSVESINAIKSKPEPVAATFSVTRDGEVAKTTQGVFYNLHPTPNQTAVVAHRNIDIHRTTDIHQRTAEITPSRTHYLPHNAINTTNYTTHSNIIGGDKQSPITIAINYPTSQSQAVVDYSQQGEMSYNMYHSHGGISYTMSHNLATTQQNNSNLSTPTNNIINYSIENIKNSLTQPEPESKSIKAIEELDEKGTDLMEKKGDKWACTKCGKVMPLWHMKRHVEVHIDGVTFPCGTCGKSSKTSHGLYQHMAKKHPEVRQNQLLLAKHKCSICGKPSKTSKGLSNHRWKYHKDRPRDESYASLASNNQWSQQQPSAISAIVKQEQICEPSY